MRSLSSVSIRRCLSRLRGHSLLVATVVLVIGLVVVVPASAPTASFAFTAIDVSGVSFTEALRITRVPRTARSFAPPSANPTNGTGGPPCSR